MIGTGAKASNPGLSSPPPPGSTPVPADAAIAFELIVVDRRKVTAGGVTAAKRPQDRRNSRRSLVGSFFSDATRTSIKTHTY